MLPEAIEHHIYTQSGAENQSIELEAENVTTLKYESLEMFLQSTPVTQEQDEKIIYSQGANRNSRQSNLWSEGIEKTPFGTGDIYLDLLTNISHERTPIQGESHPRQKKLKPCTLAHLDHTHTNLQCEAPGTSNHHTIQRLSNRTPRIFLCQHQALKGRIISQ